METKEVNIQNIKFNLSTKPLVSEPETYPDYPSVPVNQITNKIITNLINYLPEYPWYEYIYNSNDQFDENLPELINAGNHFISIYINTDDCLIEFSTEQPDSSDNLSAKTIPLLQLVYTSQYTSIKPNCPGLTKVPGLFYVHT